MIEENVVSFFEKISSGTNFFLDASFKTESGYMAVYVHKSDMDEKLIIEKTVPAVFLELSEEEFVEERISEYRMMLKVTHSMKDDTKYSEF